MLHSSDLVRCPGADTVKSAKTDGDAIMSHGVHAVQHEVEHKIQHDEEHGKHGDGHGDTMLSRNKRVALLIAVIALFLAFSETLGKSAQTNALNHQIEASNLWNFFQAKNIRRTSTHRRFRADEGRPAGAMDGPQKAAMKSRSTTGTRLQRAIARSPKRAAARARARSSWRGARSRSSVTATQRSPSIITTRWPRPRSRSASCSPRRRLSPAS